MSAITIKDRTQIYYRGYGVRVAHWSRPSRLCAGRAQIM